LNGVPAGFNKNDIASRSSSMPESEVEERVSLP